MTDARIVTILFTDLVGSTRLAERHGDQIAEQVRRAHFGLLRDALATHGGQEVKSTGDGQMAVFPSAVDAVACATEFQRAVDRYNRRPATALPLDVRVGLHVGEPIREGDDYYGSTVNVAARLCSAAKGGQILASDVVRALARTQSSAQFLRLDAIELKGVEEPVEPYEVVWTPATGAAVPLPPALTTATRSAFVGREAAFEALQTEWKRAMSGERRTVLIAGEPGIGKTRLARELAHEASDQGAVVLFGRCDEDALVPYQPFVEALRFYASVCPANELAEQLGEAAADLGRLVPEIGDRIPGLTAPAGADPETERYRLFRAVAHLLTEAARNAPVLLVLDDLHWSDRPTLALLRHVLRDPEPAPLLVCGTYRDTDLDRKHPFAETLADLRRENAYERVLLRGLNQDEIVAMLESAAAQKMDPAGLSLAEALETETEGNPFFIEEIVLNLVETGRIYRSGDRWVSDARSPAQLDIPEGVREAVGRRLSRLSDDANQALAHACVLGPRFEYTALRAMTEMDDARLAKALEEARNIQLLLETELDGSPAFTFAHALVRQVLYEELSLPRRQQLHLAAAEALERVHRTNTPLQAIATHLRNAGAAADAQKTIDYSLLAGQAAASVFAFEDALRHLEAARGLMAATDAEPAVKARLLGFLGDLKFITGIDYESAAGDLDESLRLYEQIGDDARAGAMHSRLGRHFSSFGGRMVDIDRALEHFRSAERLLSAGPPRAALGYTHAGFAAAALWGMRTTEGLEAADRAVDMARRLGNDQLLAHATMLRGWHLWSSGKPDEGVTLLERAYEAADGIGNASLAFFAAWMRGFTAAFMGDLIDGLSWLERELAKPRIAEAPNLRFSLEAQIGNASYFMGDVSVYRRLGDDFAAGTPAVAYYDGDWEEGRRRSRDNIANARRAGNSLEEFAQAGSLATSYYMTNELDRAEPLFLELSARDHRPFEVWSRHMLAAICCRTQRLDDAQEHLARIRRIVGATQGWRAMTAQLAFAEAMCMAAGNRTQDAEHAFAEAVNTLRSHHIVWEHAMYLRDWARSRAANGDASGADEKLDEAAGVYRGIGANERWLHIVDSERP